MLLYKNHLVVLVLMISYLLSLTHVPPQFKAAPKSTQYELSEAHTDNISFGIKEESVGQSATIKVSLFIKDVVPSSFLFVRPEGESHYLNTRSRLLWVLWNPTIPIALRKLTI